MKKLLIVSLVFFGNLLYAQKEESDNSFAGNKNKPARQEWLRDLGFGMFIHFNVDAQLGITISHSLVGASDDYVKRYFNELPKTFDPYKFNPAEIAKLAKLAGMKYVVFTAKHHSGFCFWDTKTTLQKPNGLFYHAPDVPYFWGRGDGWMAVGMAELLRSVPKDNPNRACIMKGYKTMMASLLKYQAETGMWRQLIDDAESWPETSCTGMFTFAMITGVKNGWLDAATYGPAARKGWLALISYINEDADIREVCEGTNKKNDRQYYLDRKRNIGDLHGQAPVLWCATALLR